MRKFSSVQIPMIGVLQIIKSFPNPSIFYGFELGREQLFVEESFI